MLQGQTVSAPLTTVQGTALTVVAMVSAGTAAMRPSVNVTQDTQAHCAM